MDSTPFSVPRRAPSLMPFTSRALAADWSAMEAISCREEATSSRVDACSDVTLLNNVLDQNSGAENGGGLYVVGSTNITVQGGSISRHQASNSGGGAQLDASHVALRGVRFERNTSDFSHGGLAVVNACSISSSGAKTSPI